MLKLSDYEPFTLKGLIMEIVLFCIESMILDSEYHYSCVYNIRTIGTRLTTRYNIVAVFSA